MDIQIKGDYQQFDLADGVIGNVEGRMSQKMSALETVLPDWEDKKVLDIGCDFGYWSFLAASQGAQVLGLDRSREVKDFGWVDLPARNNKLAALNGLDATFMPYDAGKQWHDVGQFDVVLMMSLYHHIYHNCGSHEAIWYWLARIGGMVIWENPVEANDSVVQLNVDPSLHASYNETQIRAAAERYFKITYEGPALHEKTRVVWRLEPKETTLKTYQGKGKSGAGGASKAFSYDDGRRIAEIEYALNISPIPGSFNAFLWKDFDWDARYYRTGILDVVDRHKGLDSPWSLRPCRFYPIGCNGNAAFVMRFEGEKYPLDMVEMISDIKLNSDDVVITQWQ